MVLQVKVVQIPVFLYNTCTNTKHAPPPYLRDLLHLPPAQSYFQVRVFLQVLSSYTATNWVGSFHGEVQWAFIVNINNVDTLEQGLVPQGLGKRMMQIFGGTDWWYISISSVSKLKVYRGSWRTGGGVHIHEHTLPRATSWDNRCGLVACQVKLTFIHHQGRRFEWWPRIYLGGATQPLGDVQKFWKASWSHLYTLIYRHHFGHQLLCILDFLGDPKLLPCSDQPPRESTYDIWMVHMQDATESTYNSTGFDPLQITLLPSMCITDLHLPTL